MQSHGRILPGQAFDDWGEMQVVPHVLGIPHPTGYPTYVLVAWLFVAAVAFTFGPRLSGEQVNDASTFLLVIPLSDEQIAEALEGNLCRCTGYVNIVASVRQAAQQMAGGQS